MKEVNWKVLLLSLAAVFLIAYIGSIFTTPNTSTEWYESIKPSITPPNWVFPIVWNILFLLIAISLYLTWIKSNEKQKPKIATIFALNLILNALWSYLYFGLQNPLAAFYDLIVIWFSIIAMIHITNKINKTSSYLLIPYLLWVSFAGILNYLSI